MSRFPEITSLFVTLASNIKTPDSTASNKINRSILNLYRSLNPSEVPRTRVLDTALSLMCIPAPQVYDSVIEYTLRAIVTVLSSSIECKVSKINKDKALMIGGSIGNSDLTNIMEWSGDILRKLKDSKGDLCDLLLYSVIRLAAIAPRLQYPVHSKSVIENKFKDGRPYSFANLLCHLPNNISIRSGEIPLRLLLWNLDPKILKHDVSEILQEVTKRPFLSLSTEFYERMEWRSKITCLVISPSVFIQARALLHNWFLVTGFASIMEFQTQLVVQVLDITSRPMWWGLCMEIGSKLPFSHAYFPNNQSFRILSGPISQEYFQQLLHELIRPISLAGKYLHTSSKKATTNITPIDHKSSWAMAMNFPGWFSFASVLLFYDNIRTDSYYSGFIPGLAKPYLLHDVEIPCSVGAAMYIAWILNPFNESYQDLLLDYLGKVSELWIRSSNKSNKVARGHMNETQRALKLHNNDDITSHELDSRTVFLWLKEFKEKYIRYSETKVVSSTYEGLRIHQNLLLQKIPLGILIGYLNHLNAVGCAMLLHYAAIGTVEKLPETQNLTKIGKLKCATQADSITWAQKYTRAEAIAGCKIVFEITDIIETLSSLFETEENGLNFIFQMKIKAGDYLFRCIKRILQLQYDGDDIQMRGDLLARLIHWRRQGQNVFQNDKDFDRVCDSLNAP